MKENPEARRAAKYGELWMRPGYLVRRLHQIHVGLFAEECAGEGITQVQFGVLSILESGSEMDQFTLSTAVGIDRTSGADVFRRLERKGLLTRKPSEHDGRAKLIKITDRGCDLVARLRPMMERAQDRFTSPLTTAEGKEFYRLMNKLIDANNDASRAPLKFGR